MVSHFFVILGRACKQRVEGRGSSMRRAEGSKQQSVFDTSNAGSPNALAMLAAFGDYSEKRKHQPACKPGSVWGCPRDGHSSGTPVAGRLVQSTRAGSVRTRLASAVSRSACPPLFDLAPGGVCPATSVTRGAVRSYRTFSPLPPSPKARRRYVLCGTFPGVAPGGR